MSPRRPTRRPPVDPARLDALVELSFSIQDLIARVAVGHGLSVTQVRLFGSLRDREPTMTDLKDHLALEKSSVTGLIDRAEDRGLVARTTGHPDGRAVRVRLTEQGAELAARFADQVYSELDGLLAPLADRDQRQLFRLADAVLAGQTSAFGQERPAPNGTD